MVLVYYEQTWGVSLTKDHLVITLRNGIPTFSVNKGQAYTVTGISSIADKEWHHLALTVPKQSCLSSEILLYIDGDKTTVDSLKPSSPDNHVFFTTTGKMNLGGFGYASEAAFELYNKKVQYLGELDDITVWSRTLSVEDILILSSNASLEPSSSPSPSPSITNPPSQISSDLVPTTNTTDLPSLRPTIYLTDTSPSQTPDFPSLPTKTASKSPSNLSSSPSQFPVFACDGNNCMDDKTFEFTLKNGNVRKCAWIGKRNTANHSAMYCVYEEIKVRAKRAAA
jgi:hypothetical protein